jgi:transposase
MEINLQVHHVVSDITGATGMQIIRAIVAGERDPDVLASFRDIRCHSSVETIRAALVGNDRAEHIFALTQSLELYDTYQTMMEDCDRKLEAAIAALTVKASGAIAPLPKARIKGKQINAPSFDVRAALHGVIGVDLTQIHGLGPSLALKLIAECGTDLKAWPSAKHFTSWLCLAPRNKISGVSRYLRERDDHPVGPQPYYDWRQLHSGGVTRRSEHFIAVSRHGLESKRLSPPRLARSLSCFTTLCASG